MRAVSERLSSVVAAARARAAAAVDAAGAGCGPGEAWRNDRRAQHRIQHGVHRVDLSKRRHGSCPARDLGSGLGAEPAVERNNAAADDHAHRPDQAAMKTIPEIGLMAGLVPARAHAAGNVAAGHERADLLRHRPENGDRRNDLRRAPELGQGEVAERPMAGAESEQDERDRRGENGAGENRPPFDEA